MTRKSLTGMTAAVLFASAAAWSVSYGQPPVQPPFPTTAAPAGVSADVLTVPVPPAFNFQPRAHVYISPGDADRERKVEAAIRELVKETDTTKRADLSKSAKELLSAQFDERQKVRENQLKELEERVKKLRDQLDKRQQAKDQIIQSRYDDLLRNAEGLGWGDSAAVGPNGLVHPGGLIHTVEVAPQRIELFEERLDRPTVESIQRVP